MRELRLVPGAATAWLAVIAVLLGGRGWAVFIIAAVVGCCLIARQWGQALFSGMVATAAALVAAVRQARAAAFDLGTEVTGRLTTAPTQTSTGGWLLRLKCRATRLNCRSLARNRSRPLRAPNSRPGWR